MGEELGRGGASRFLLEIGEHLPLVSTSIKQAGCYGDIASQKPLGIECYAISLEGGSPSRGHSFARLDRNGRIDLAAKVRAGVLR
jgi:hypothetical protein